MSGAPWRVGEHYAVHVYSGDRPVATFHDAADAQRCVDAMGRAEADWRTIKRLIAELSTFSSASSSLTSRDDPPGVNSGPEMSRDGDLRARVAALAKELEERSRADDAASGGYDPLHQYDFRVARGIAYLHAAERLRAVLADTAGGGS